MAELHAYAVEHLVESDLTDLDPPVMRLDCGLDFYTEAGSAGWEGSPPGPSRPGVHPYMRRKKSNRSEWEGYLYLVSLKRDRGTPLPRCPQCGNGTLIDNYL